MTYTILHAHSDYSLLDSVAQPKAIAKRLNKIGVTACATTEHGNCSGAVKISETFKKAKIKPLLGIEFYIAINKSERKNVHLLLIAKNKEGWRDLIKIVGAANQPENFYYKPRLTLEELAPYLHGNIVGISGHLGSTFTQFVFDGDDVRSDAYEKCREHALYLQKIFGKENFFLEVQLIDADNNPSAKIIANIIREVANSTGIPSVATPDSHYCERSDACDQQIVLCSKMETTLREIQQKLVEDEDVGLAQFFKTNSYHIPSYDEMAAIHTEAELKNTILVSDMCENYDITGKPLLPKFPTPNGEDSNDYLRQLCRNGWTNKLNDIHRVMQLKGLTLDDYKSRFDKEFNIMAEFGLADYFLMVHDIIEFAKKSNIYIGAGRGSAAGSLILFLLGVTSANPFEYDLIFERFLNAGRFTKDHISLPDVDMDFEARGREKIISYIKQRYGKDRVAQIATFSRMQGRSAIKDVLRVHEAVDFNTMNAITEFIPDEAAISDKLQEMREESEDGEASIIQWSLENNIKGLSQWCYVKDDGELDGPLSKLFEQAIRLEGTKRSIGKHAAGIVIAPEPLAESCPMMHDKNSGEMVCAMEKTSLEAMGFLKMDVLGVSTLDRIHLALDLINGDEDEGLNDL